MTNVLYQVQRFLTRGTLRWWLAPLSYMLFGLLSGLRFGAFKWLPTVLVYGALCAAYFVEWYFVRTRYEQKKPHPLAIGLFEGALFLFLGGLFVTTNWLFASLMVLYALGIHSFFIPRLMKGTAYYVLLQAFFKGYLANALVFYLQANFISHQFLWQSVPLLAAVTFVVAKSDLLDFRLYNRAARLSAHLYQLWATAGLVLSYALPVVIFVSTGIPWSLQFVLALLLWLISLALNLVGFFAASQNEGVKKQQHFIFNVFLIYLIAFSFLY